MRTRGRIFIFMLFFLALPLPFGAWAVTGGDESGILVGRISHVEGGNLLRYVVENSDWVATVQDAPFGLEDALYAERDAKAEFIMPNGTWIRIGGDTQLQMIALDPDTTSVDVASGLARMYNKNPNAIIKATTPFGYVTAPADAVFDLYVGDQSLEVIAVRGIVDFVHEATGTRYQVRERDASLIADKSGVSRGNGTVDAAWDDWNTQRDSLWARRLSSQGQSAGYLPDAIRDESYALDENGQWENVYYEGSNYPMWRPISVGSAWSPFTEGRWTVYYDDNCWIPAEPFGYVTHHYGSWVWVKPLRRWYWRPPVARMFAASPGFFISFGWYPGRVGWIHSGSNIGWVPLAPGERYYAHRPWGRSAILINRGQTLSINISQYRYLDRAVIIPPNYLYRGNRYTPYVQRVGRTAIVNGYKPAPAIDRTVFRAYDSDTRRFAFNDAKVERKPHATALNRISDNRRLAANTGAASRQQIQQNLGKTRLAALPAAATISAPIVSSRLVDASKVNQPAQNLSFPKREMKPQERQRQPNTTPAQMSGQRGQARPAAGSQAMPGSETAAPALGTSGPAARPAFNQRPATRDQGINAQGNRPPLGQDNQQRIISPRERVLQEQDSPSWQQRQQPRAPGANQQQEIQRRQQDDSQRLQQQDMQRRQQLEQQRLQQQEAQQRQQMEAQRQQQEMQRRQQQEQQQRLQQQEAQQRQQAEAQRQQQEMQRRQQEEQQQRLQQQEAQRRQQAEAQRQQQEMQRRQQEQQQEIQRRQQEESQRRQQQEAQRRKEKQQQEEQQSQQEDSQSPSQRRQPFGRR